MTAHQMARNCCSSTLGLFLKGLATAPAAAWRADHDRSDAVTPAPHASILPQSTVSPHLTCATTNKKSRPSFVLESHLHLNFFRRILHAGSKDSLVQYRYSRLGRDNSDIEKILSTHEPEVKNSAHFSVGSVKLIVPRLFSNLIIPQEVHVVI